MPYEILKILPDIYDATLRPELWQKALDQLTRLFNSRSTIIMAYDLEDRPFSLNVWSSLYTAEDLQDYTKKFSCYEQQIAEYLRNCPSRFIGRDVDIWPNLEFERDRPDLKYLQERFGIIQRCGAELNTHSAWKDYVTVQHGREWKDVPESFWEMLKLTIPHLSKTVEIGRTFALLKLRHQAILAALDKIGIGMCIATSEGYIAVYNKEAERIFSLVDGLSLNKEGFLVTRNDELTQEIRNSISVTAKTANGEGINEEVSLACPRTSDATPFLVEISPLRDSAAELQARFSGSLVCIIDPDETSDFSIHGFARIFNLTKAETEVCEALIHGQTGAHIAEQRNVSRETVRTQIRSIYWKLGISSRVELVRLSLLVNPPIL